MASNFMISHSPSGILLPPPTPDTDPDWASVVFAMSGNDLLDARGNNVSNVGGIVIDTTRKKYGTGSIAFPNNAAKYLQLDPMPQLRFTGDFTIEGWVYLSSQPAVQPFFAFEDNSMLIQLQSGNIVWYVNGIASGWAGNAGPTFATGAWIHLACERYQNVCRAFVNGVISGVQPTHAENLGSTTSRFVIGRNNQPVGMHGNMADIRISLKARYQGVPFTPPAAQFANH